MNCTVPIALQNCLFPNNAPKTTWSRDACWPGNTPQPSSRPTPGRDASSCTSPDGAPLGTCHRWTLCGSRILYTLPLWWVPGEWPKPSRRISSPTAPATDSTAGPETRLSVTYRTNSSCVHCHRNRSWKMSLPAFLNNSQASTGQVRSRQENGGHRHFFDLTRMR